MLCIQTSLYGPYCLMYTDIHKCVRHTRQGVCHRIQYVWSYRKSMVIHFTVSSIRHTVLGTQTFPTDKTVWHTLNRDGIHSHMYAAQYNHYGHTEKAWSYTFTHNIHTYTHTHIHTYTHTHIHTYTHTHIHTYTHTHIQ
jgi:hypothetical protein